MLLSAHGGEWTDWSHGTILQPMSAEAATERGLLVSTCVWRSQNSPLVMRSFGWGWLRRNAWPFDMSPLQGLRIVRRRIMLAAENVL